MRWCTAVKSGEVAELTMHLIVRGGSEGELLGLPVVMFCRDGSTRKSCASAGSRILRRASNTLDRLRSRFWAPAFAGGPTPMALHVRCVRLGAVRAMLPQSPTHGLGG